MSACPWCGRDFVPISDVVYRNVETYGSPSVIVAKCCGNSVLVTRRISYSLSASHQKVDDWGYAAKPKKGERK